MTRIRRVALVLGVALAGGVLSSAPAHGDGGTTTLLSFQATPDPVDTRSGPAVVHALVHLVTTGAPLVNASLSFIGNGSYVPGQTLNAATLSPATRTSGDANDGWYDVTTTVPPGLTSTAYTASLSAYTGGATTQQVPMDGAGFSALTTPDTEPPQVGTPSASSIDLPVGCGTYSPAYPVPHELSAVLTLSISDAGVGVSAVEGAFTNEAGASIAFQALDAGWNLTIPGGSACGDYALTGAVARDRNGNSTDLPPVVLHVSRGEVPAAPSPVTTQLADGSKVLVSWTRPLPFPPVQALTAEVQTVLGGCVVARTGIGDASSSAAIPVFGEPTYSFRVAYRNLNGYGPWAESGEQQTAVASPQSNVLLHVASTVSSVTATTATLQPTPECTALPSYLNSRVVVLSDHSSTFAFQGNGPYVLTGLLPGHTYTGFTYGGPQGMLAPGEPGPYDRVEPFTFQTLVSDPSPSPTSFPTATPSPTPSASPTPPPAPPVVVPQQPSVVSEGYANFHFDFFGNPSQVAGAEGRYRRIAANGSGFLPGFVQPARWADSPRYRYGYPATHHPETFQVAASGGSTYCASARARNVGGVRSAWSKEVCTTALTPFQLLRVSTAWHRRTADVYAQTTGARMSYHVALTRTLALQVYTCPSCGAVTVYWNGRVIKNLDLRSSTGRKRIPIATFSGLTHGDLLIVTKNAHLVSVSGLATRGF